MNSSHFSPKTRQAFDWLTGWWISLYSIGKREVLQVRVKVPFSGWIQSETKLKPEAASTLTLMCQIILVKNYHTTLDWLTK